MKDTCGVVPREQSGPVHRPAWGQGEFVPAWVSQCKGGRGWQDDSKAVGEGGGTAGEERSKGGGGNTLGELGQIQTPVLGLSSVTRGARICTCKIMGTEPTSSIGRAGAQHSVRGKKSLYSMLHPSLLLTCARYSTGLPVQSMDCTIKVMNSRLAQ